MAKRGSRQTGSESEAVERAEARERRTSRAAIKALQLNWLSEVTIGGAAFVLSLSIAGGSFVQFLLGPEIDVLPPQQVIFYRGGLPNRAVLYAALRLPIVNKASSYNDVIVDATLQPFGDNPRIPYATMVSPVFNDEDDPEQSKVHCVQGRRCHFFKRMAISELSDDVVVIPGGGAHAYYYSFRMFCRDEPGCADFASFDQAVAALQARSRKVGVELKLYADGTRTITCPIASINAEHLRKVGWQSINCENPTVTGTPFL
ncbi:MAG TPA: hypothetical protein VIT45_13370 [Allosphingosinicella sp.]